MRTRVPYTNRELKLRTRLIRRAGRADAPVIRCAFCLSALPAPAREHRLSG